MNTPINDGKKSADRASRGNVLDDKSSALAARQHARTISLNLTHTKEPPWPRNLLPISAPP